MDFPIGIIRVTPLRLVVFAALVAAFFAWFGYWPADVSRVEYFSPRRVARAYLACAALFVAAAGLACFGEYEYGLFPPTSLRPVLIGFGGFVMLVAVIWMHSLSSAVPRRDLAPESRPDGGAFRRAPGTDLSYVEA